MRIGIIIVAVLLLLAAGALVLQNQLSPARQLGWNAPPPEHAPTPENAPAATAAPRADRLGFAKWLPADADVCLAFLQAGPLWRNLRSSRAWKSVAETDDVKRIADEVNKEIEPERAKLPPEFQETLDLLADAFDTEVCVAVGADSAEGGVDFAAAGIYSALMLAPSIIPPGHSLEMQLDSWRRSMARDWVEAARRARIPSALLAAKVTDPARFDAMVYKLIDRVRKSAEEASAGPPSQPKVGPPPTAPAHDPKAAFEKIYQKAAIGQLTFQRFTFRLGDHVTPEELEKEMRDQPDPPPEMGDIRKALLEKTLVFHIGFVGPYFTLAIGPDDSMLQKVVALYEGRDPAGLAASERLASLREEVKDNATGYAFLDLQHLHAALRQKLVPALKQAEDPERLSWLNAPAPLAGMVKRWREQMEPPASDADYVRVESVQYIDAGLKAEQRSTLPAGAPPPAGAVESPKLVPADAIGYTAMSYCAWDAIWYQIRYTAAMQLDAFAKIEKDPRQGPRYAKAIADGRAACRALLDPIEKDLEPHLRGSMTGILGAPVPLNVTAAETTIEGLPIPSAAIAVATDDPAAVIRGIRALVPALQRFFGGPPERGAGAPVVVTEKQVDGATVHAIDVSASISSGFEPHLFVLGKTVVFSSSYVLSAAMRKTAGGGPSIVDTPMHQTMAPVLDKDAYAATFVDGGKAAALFAGLSDGIFAEIEKQEAEKMSAEARTRFGQARRITRSVGEVLKAHRGLATATVREKGVDVERQWFYLEDLGGGK